MGKKKDKARAKAADGAPKLPKRVAGVKLPKDLRKAGDQVLAQANSPAGRQAIAGALALAAGAIAQRAQAKTAERDAAKPQPATAAPEPATKDAQMMVEALGGIAATVLQKVLAAKAKS